MYLGAVLVVSGSMVVPETSAFATDTSQTYNSIQKSDEFDKYFNDLSEDKKIEFQTLVKEANLSRDEQLQILKEKYNSDREITFRWKGAVIKKVARWLADKVGEKSVSSVTNYLFEWQDNLKQGDENYFIHHGWNRTATHWAVKTASFIFL